MKNTRYDFKIYKVVDGQEKTLDASLYPCNPRKLMKWFADHEMYKTVKKPDESGEIKTIREYTGGEGKDGYGWCEANRDELKTFLESEHCDYPLTNGVTLDDIVDTIMTTDSLFLRWYYGNEKKGIDGFLEKCNEATIKLS